MRKVTTYIGVLAAVVALAVLPGCDTDSPTAPEQSPPGPGGGSNQTAYNIEIRADPQEIDVNLADPSGQQCAVTNTELGQDSLSTLRITVREKVTNKLPPDGTTILLEANLGTFEPFGGLPVQAVGRELVNGRVFVNYYACSTAGTATIRASLGTSIEEERVIIRATPLIARWSASNPEGNNSVQFANLSDGQPDRVEWRFGDGQTSTDFNPIHVYNLPGSYSVTLTIFKKNRSDECRTTIGTGSMENFTCNVPATDPPAP